MCRNRNHIAAKRHGTAEQRGARRCTPLQHSRSFIHGTGISERIAEINVIGIHSKPSEYRSTVGPYLSDFVAVGGYNLGTGSKGSLGMLGACRNSKHGTPGLAHRLVVHLNPFIINLYYRISEGAVAHIKSAHHYTWQVGTRSLASCRILSPTVIMTVDMPDNRIVLKYSEIVGTVVKVVEQGIVVHRQHPSSGCGHTVES